MKLRECIQLVQETAQQHNTCAVIVGGAIVRLIGTKTKIEKISETTQTIVVSHLDDPDIQRPEDSKTTIDIDCIAFSTLEDPFTHEAKENFAAFQKDIQRITSSTKGFPAVSVEPVLYHPYFPKPNPLFQFVSSVESYHDHDFFFRLGQVKQDVSLSSLAFWKYVYGKEMITSFHPIAILERYRVRGFGIKPKDKEKIQNSTFARFVSDFNTKTKGNFEKDIKEWHDFAKNVQNAKQPSMKVKKQLWNTYWQTIGTYVAHGTGFVGKILLPLGNTFFAGK